MRTKLFIGMCLLSIQISAFAGGSMVGGGGNAIADSSGKISLLDLVESDDKYLNSMQILNEGIFSNKLSMRTEETLYLAVTDPASPFKEGSTARRHSFLSYIYKTFGKRTSVQDYNLNWKFQPIPLMWILTDKSLASLNDQGEMEDIDPETLIQIAVQRDGIVLIDQPNFYLMDSKSQNALLMHEALIRLVSETNPDLIAKKGTAPIRKFNKLLIDRIYGAFVPDAALQKAFNELGIPELASY